MHRVLFGAVGPLRGMENGQQPRISRPAVVSGGRLKAGDHNVWILQTTTVKTDCADIEFVHLSKKDRKLAAFLGFDLGQSCPLRTYYFGEYLGQLRNEATVELMAKRHDETVGDSHSSPPLAVKRRRRDYIDDMPPYVTVTVPDPHPQGTVDPL